MCENLAKCVKFSLSVRNEFVGHFYFRWVCEIGSQGVQNDSLILHACENFIRCANWPDFSFV